MNTETKADALFMANTIPVNLSPEFRNQVARSIRCTGIKRTERHLLNQGMHESFVKCLIRSIMGREGW